MAHAYANEVPAACLVNTELSRMIFSLNAVTKVSADVRETYWLGPCGHFRRESGAFEAAMRGTAIAMVSPMTSPSLFSLFAACSDYGQTAVGAVDEFDVSDRQAIDVLLVVDNSSSMAPYQAKLGANFSAFIQPFVDGNLDYHIGITTTDDGNDAAVDSPASGEFVAPIITSDMELDEAESVFLSGVNVGTEGSGFEVGLKAAALALTDELHLGDQIAEFLRVEASLSIIFVSDEEDQSPESVSAYVNTFWSIKGRRRWDAFNASALTVSDASQCAADTTDYSTPGTRYLDVATQTLGASGNLCSDNFGEIVHELAIVNTQALDTYVLTGEPLSVSLDVAVEVGGVETPVPCDLGEWAYARVAGGAQPAVIFERDHLPAAGAIVRIRYTLGNGSADGFCEEGE